jgi:subtilisin family serine protease
VSGSPGRLGERSAERLEDGLQNVARILSVHQADVQRQPGGVGERLEEAGSEVAAEPAGPRLGEVDVARNQRPLRDLQRDLGERLFGRKECRPVAWRAVGAKQRSERIAECAPRIRNLRLGVARRELERQLEPAGPRQEHEQMVEHGDARGDVGRTPAGRNSRAHGRGAYPFRGVHFFSGLDDSRGRIPAESCVNSTMRLKLILTAFAATAFVTAASGTAAIEQGTRTAWPKGTAVVTYTGDHALAQALSRRPATIVRRIPALRVVEVRPRGRVDRYAAALASEPGIVSVERASPRRSLVEPALLPDPAGGPLQWQYAAVRADLVPAEVTQAAAGVTIAVIDTGADVLAPDLAAKAPVAYSVRSRSRDVTDLNGHGTFVAALAAGSASNGEGVAGVAGETRLMVVQAGGPAGSFTDVEEAAAIVYAVDHGARILNLSLGGPSTSTTERRAIEYAVSRGVLLVAAVGNSFEVGNAVEYPAAHLQPIGSRGVGGVGLAVAASNRAGGRASFSSTGTHVSLAAPGEDVFSAVSSNASSSRYPRTPLPGSLGGLYGYGSGTSFAAPQVAGAAALVWAANPSLRADEVASVLEQTASGQGVWSAELGYGVLDVAAAVARAQQLAAAQLRLGGRRTGSRVELSWNAPPGVASFTVSVAHNGGAQRVLTPVTTGTTASYAVAPGRIYSFTIAAVDADGAVLSVSTPWTVAVRRAPARISLKASRLQGVRRVALAARLAVEGVAGAERARTVVLEAFDGLRWSRAATAVTDGTGRAVWRYALAAGSYRVRARYPGTDEIAPATSAPVKLTLR